MTENAPNTPGPMLSGIKVLDLTIDDTQALEGILQIRLEYIVRSTNSRFNLVYPFYQIPGE